MACLPLIQRRLSTAVNVLLTVVCVTPVDHVSRPILLRISAAKNLGQELRNSLAVRMEPR